MMPTHMTDDLFKEKKMLFYCVQKLYHKALTIWFIVNYKLSKNKKCTAKTALLFLTKVNESIIMRSSQVESLISQ